VSTPQYPNDPQWQGNQDPNYPTQPGYPPQPSYPQQPNYPQQPAYPSQPLYPQYGDPQQPGYPAGGYGYGGPPSQYPGQPTYGGPGGPPPRKPNRLPLILGIVAGVVLLCVVVPGVLLVVAAGRLGTNAQRLVHDVEATETASAAQGTPTAATDLTIYDNPMTGVNTDWQNDTNCSFKPDGYHITAAFICYAPPEDVGNVVVSVTAKQVSGVTNAFYGLVLRRTSKGNYYAFEIDGNGKWVFDVVKDNTVTRLVDVTANPAIQPGLGVANILQVRAVGSHFQFSVNGTQVGQIDDSTFLSGLLGLGGKDGLDVVYTNFKATQPAA
jgi:hypothetical protein